jgi:hypothetical protein
MIHPHTWIPDLPFVTPQIKEQLAMRSRTISNRDDVIDSRDVIARLEELTEERQALADADDATADLEAWGAENGEELAALHALSDEASGYADWTYGASLIRDSYFEEYAQELADDIGAIDRNANWPLNCIDWKRAARELRMDYRAVEFDGVTYWIQSC